MNKGLLIVLALVALAVPVTAETYRISGTSTFGDGTPASFQDITIACQRGDSNCYQYQGSDAMTDNDGVYTLTINADDDDNGTEILLTLRGEQFLHVIDLDTFRMTADNRMTQDLQLSQSPPMPGFGGGAGCCLLLFALVFVSTLLKTVAGLATPRGRAAFQGFREPNYHECPECNASIVQHQLVVHFITEHDYDPVEAGEATGLVLRKSWFTGED